MDGELESKTLRQRRSAATTQLEVRVKGSSVCLVSGCWVERVTCLRPIPCLFRFLELLYKQLVAHSLEPNAAPIKTLRNALAHAVSGQVLG